ncbi:MAG: deoxyribose-phosphate aldolase [Candidatus Ventricola sp.]
MELKRILSMVDHTLLKPESTWAQIREICDDAIRYGTATVCIPASYVARCKAYMQEKGSRVGVCTVIGFPTGYSTTAAKVFEAADAVKNGADEVDMVINIGMLKDGHDDEVLAEINAIKAACAGKPLKVIIETCLLTEEEKIRMCSIVSRSDADFIKTSTGFSTAGATFEDVALMKAHMAPGKGIKAAGGIASLADAEKFIELGATRLGTSRIVKIVKNEEATGY